MEKIIITLLIISLTGACFSSSFPVIANLSEAVWRGLVTGMVIAFLYR